jgi:hypothetical protein
MRTLLLFPPPTDPAHPPLGIAALAGYLSAHGEDVLMMDLNIRAYSELLTAGFLSRCATRLRRRMDGFRRRRRIAARDLSAYRAVAENVLSADWLIERIDGARQRLREPATYASRQAYAETTAIIRRAMQFVSAAHHPASWSIGGFVMSRYAMRSADVVAATDDRSENLFIPLFEAALPEIVALQPRVIGISLNYRMQMIPAMTLASMIRKALPEAFIVVGGGLVCFFEDDWNVLAPFCELVDAWIPFEGEKPLLDLIQALSAGRDLDGVAGLMRFRGGRVVYRSPAAPLPLAELPPPLFDGLPLHEYLAPEPIVPLLTSRGCYWGRCTFCAHGHLYRAQFRSASATTVLDTMKGLSRNSGVMTFYFVDEATPPRVALDLASSIESEGLPFRWFTEARFERYFDAERLKRIAAGGCRMLMFGLESAVPRVLDLMEKGITPALAAQILRDCRAAGIRTYVMFFSGFPTETHEEADRTVQFIERHRQDITQVCGGQFVLEPQSPAYRDRERFSITRVYPYPDEDLKTWSQYDVSEGMTLEEAGEVAREIEALPVIRPPDFHLVSRSHLIFLPHVDNPHGDAAATLPHTDNAQHLVPLRRPDLIPERLPFNLDEVQARLRDGSTSPLSPNPTDYVFSPDREALVEVGSDGLALLKACNGDFELADILAAVGENGREETLRFFRDLEQRQFISWEASP